MEAFRAGAFLAAAFLAGAFLVVLEAGADFAATTFCRRGAPGCFAPRPSRIGARNEPVWLSGTAATSSGAWWTPATPSW